MIRLNNSKGFTLIEALISIWITGSLILVSSFSLLRLYDYINLNQSLAVLQDDLAYVRQYNMLPHQTNNRMILQIYHDKGYYNLVKGNQAEAFIHRPLPPRVKIESAYPVSDILFNSLGHISKGQSFIVKTPSFSKEIVFSIGMGGIDIRDSN